MDDKMLLKKVISDKVYNYWDYENSESIRCNEIITRFEYKGDMIANYSVISIDKLSTNRTAGNRLVGNINHGSNTSYTNDKIFSYMYFVHGMKQGVIIDEYKIDYQLNDISIER